MQTTYNQDPSVAFPGMPGDDGFKDDISTVVEETNGIAPGLVVVRGTGGDRTARAVPVVAADSNGIIESHATVASPTVFTTVDADGDLGAGPYVLPQKLILTVPAHADIAADDWVITFEDENGVQQSETATTVENVGVTYTTTAYSRRFVSLLQPAMDGTGGAFTLGVTADATLDGGDVLGVSLRTHKARQDSAVADNENYEDEARMPVRRKGRIYVEVENAFEAGDRPLVRCIAGASESLGAIRVGDSDSGDCFPWTKARLLTSGSAGAIGVLEVNLD